MGNERTDRLYVGLGAALLVNGDVSVPDLLTMLVAWGPCP